MMEALLCASEPAPSVWVLVTYWTRSTMQMIGIRKPAAIAAISCFGVRMPDSCSLCASLIIPSGTIFETGGELPAGRHRCSLEQQPAKPSIIDDMPMLGNATALLFVDANREKRYPSCLITTPCRQSPPGPIPGTPETGPKSPDFQHCRVVRCDRRPTDRIEASEALDTGSIPVGRTTRFKSAAKRTAHIPRTRQSEAPRHVDCLRNPDPHTRDHLHRTSCCLQVEG